MFCPLEFGDLEEAPRLTKLVESYSDSEEYGRRRDTGHHLTESAALGAIRLSFFHEEEDTAPLVRPSFEGQVEDHDSD